MILDSGAHSERVGVSRAAWAVFAVFVLAGFNFASWASRMPAIRDALGFSEAQMGVLLLSMALGSIVALPLSGWIMGRLGARRTVVVFAVVNALGFVGAVAAIGFGSVPGLRVALVLGGIGTGVWDAAMNVEGAVVEQRLGRTLMPRLHAGFSFGTIIGAGLGAVAAWLAVPITVHVPFAFALSLVAIVWSARFFLAVGAVPGADVGSSGARGASSFGAWLEPRTLLIGLIVLSAALTEGAANDWVGLAVVDGFGTGEVMGAVALTVFLTAMTGMRLLGTRLLDSHGRVFVLRMTGSLALVGLLIFVLVPNMWVALVGVAAWGLGAALGFPVGMSAASDDPMRAAARVSVVATIGYSAFFLGPPLLGLLAEHVGYRSAQLAIVLPVCLSLLLAHRARPLDESR